MTLDQMELAVASHVEALVQLGWRWEGRGLVPTVQTGWKAGPNGNYSHTVGVNALDTVEPAQD